MDSDARASTASERHARAAARSHPLGVPIAGADHANVALPATNAWDTPVTSPHDLLAAELTADDEETARRLKRPTDTPANVGQIIKVAAHTNRRYQQNRAAIETLANAVLRIEQSTAPATIAAMGERIDEIDKAIHSKDGIDARLGKVEGKWKLVSAIVAFAVTGSGFTLAYISNKVLDAAERKGADAVRLINVEATVNELRADLKQALMTIRYSPALPSWLQPPTKDPKP